MTWINKQSILFLHLNYCNDEDIIPIWCCSHYEPLLQHCHKLFHASMLCQQSYGADWIKDVTKSQLSHKNVTCPKRYFFSFFNFDDKGLALFEPYYLHELNLTTLAQVYKHQNTMATVLWNRLTKESSKVITLSLKLVSGILLR